MSRTFKDKPYKVLLAEAGPALDDPWHDHTPHTWYKTVPVTDDNGNPVHVYETRIIEHSGFSAYKIIKGEDDSFPDAEAIPVVPNSISDEQHNKKVWKRYDNSFWSITYYTRVTKKWPVTITITHSEYNYDGCTIDVKPSADNDWTGSLPCYYHPAWYLHSFNRNSPFATDRKRRDNRRNRYIGRNETRNLNRLFNNGENVDDAYVTDYVTRARNDWD